MTYLIGVTVALVLLVGFVALTQYELRAGTRFFAAPRTRFDAHIERIEFIVEHVDLIAFVQDEVRHAVTRWGHAAAHLSLQAVRSTEYILTRLVRHLRTQHEEEVAPRETAREFVKTLSEFKDGLEAKHPEIAVPEVTEEKVV